MSPAILLVLEIMRRHVTEVFKKSTDLVNLQIYTSVNSFLIYNPESNFSISERLQRVAFQLFQLSPHDLSLANNLICELIDGNTIINLLVITLFCHICNQCNVSLILYRKKRKNRTGQINEWSVSLYTVRNCDLYIDSI